MKKLFTFLFFAGVLAVNTGFGQATGYTHYESTDSTMACTNGLYISVAIGANPETGGVLTINWGDGSSETMNFTSDPGATYVGLSTEHGYAVAGPYTVSLSIYSGTAGTNVDAGQTFNWTANDPANCGFIYVMTSQTSPPVSYYNVPYDFTGADGITTTILPSYMGQTYLYNGLNLANAPYTVSINDAWLLTNGLVQTSSDFTITGFQSNGMALNSQVGMTVDCNVPAANPDLAINYGIAWGFAAALQSGHTVLNICNYGCSNTADAHVTFAFPAGFVPNTSALTNASVSGNVLSFDILGLSDCDYIAIPFTFPGTVAAGTPIQFIATVSNTDDTNPNNNVDTLNTIVWNSYDPNGKAVNQPTHIKPNVQETLQYAVNFQNEGNFAAMDVVISDTIDANLDLSTFQLLGTKHAVATSVNPATRVVTFSFNDINLAPASQSEEDSKGYVVYSIKENAALPVGSEIENTAYIYFDFNPAIVTNTTYNINQVLGINELTTETISMYPNPAASTIRFNGANVTSVQIYDMTGKQLLQAGQVTNNEVSVANLANGMYQVVVTTTNGMHTQKLVIRK